MRSRIRVTTSKAYPCGAPQSGECAHRGSEHRFVSKSCVAPHGNRVPGFVCGPPAGERHVCRVAPCCE
eukprot:2192942-Pyramimonas_sp.AAC.1